MVNQFSRFISNYATLLTPMHRQLKENQTSRDTAKEESLFDTPKVPLSSTDVVIYYKPYELLIMWCGTMSRGVGVVLLQGLPSPLQ